MKQYNNSIKLLNYLIIILDTCVSVVQATNYKSWEQAVTNFHLSYDLYIPNIALAILIVQFFVVALLIFEKFTFLTTVILTLCTSYHLFYYTWLVRSNSSDCECELLFSFLPLEGHLVFFLISTIFIVTYMIMS